MKSLLLIILGVFACTLITFAMTTSSDMKSTSTVTVCLLDSHGNPSPPTEVPCVIKTDAEWKQQLGAENYAILRGKGTERPFCGALLDEKQEGIYFCSGCDLPLFRSDTKFHSGTGWPSFFQPFAKENVKEITDRSHGMERVETLCVRCGGHLGHVFHDGPPPTGLRYCMNSGALVFRPVKLSK